MPVRRGEIFANYKSQAICTVIDEWESESMLEDSVW